MDREVLLTDIVLNPSAASSLDSLESELVRVVSELENLVLQNSTDDLQLYTLDLSASYLRDIIEEVSKL